MNAATKRADNPARGIVDDLGHLCGRVVHATTDPATARFQGPGLQVARITETVAQAAGATAEQFSELRLREQQPVAFNDPGFQLFTSLGLWLSGITRVLRGLHVETSACQLYTALIKSESSHVEPGFRT